MLDKRAIIQFIKSLIQFFICIHDNWTTPCNRFFQRLGRQQDKPGTLIP